MTLSPNLHGPRLRQTQPSPPPYPPAPLETCQIPPNANGVRIQFLAGADLDWKLRTRDTGACLAGYGCANGGGSDTCPADFELAGYFSTTRCRTTTYNSMRCGVCPRRVRIPTRTARYANAPVPPQRTLLPYTERASMHRAASPSLATTRRPPCVKSSTSPPAPRSGSMSASTPTPPARPTSRGATARFRRCRPATHAGSPSSPKRRPLRHQRPHRRRRLHRRLNLGGHHHHRHRHLRHCLRRWHRLQSRRTHRRPRRSHRRETVQRSTPRPPHDRHHDGSSVDFRSVATPHYSLKTSPFRSTAASHGQSSSWPATWRT